MRRREFLKIAVATLGTERAAAGTQEPAHRRRFRFFLWTDMHVRDPDVPNRSPPYPFANEKAAWALECAQGRHGVEPPDFVVSAGDIIDGEIPDYSRDFTYLKSHILDKLKVPFLPCAGNHENGQGEGIPQQSLAYDRAFGAGRHNYIFMRGGVGFLMVDTSGAHRPPDEVTAARNAFVGRGLEQLRGMPVIVVTHVPLIAMREEEPLKKSFGFSSWQVLDPGMLKTIDAQRDSVIAVLSGHLHLTGVREAAGIYHITPSGTAGYPADFASFDVFDDRIEVRMHKAPEKWLDKAGNIHSRPRHPVDYADAQHTSNETYVWGNTGERRLTIPLSGRKRPCDGGDQGLTFR